MAFGISRRELFLWKERARAGEIAIITHFWLDERFPGCTSVTKVACANELHLIRWGERYGLKPEWIHYRGSLSHFDLFGDWQKMVLLREGMSKQITKFIDGN